MFAENYHLHWIAGRVNILCKYSIFTFFFIFGLGFCGSFLCYFQKLQLFVKNKFLNSFRCILLLFVWVHFKLEILITVLCGAFFSRYVQLKSHFSDKKASALKSEKRFSRKSIQQSIKEKFHHWQNLELCKVIDNPKLHW